jgi:hypothetical protein
MPTHDKQKKMKNYLSILMVVIIILVANQSLVAQQKKKVAPRTTTTTKSNYNTNNSSVQSQPVQQKTTYQEPVISSTSSQKATSYSSSNENTSNMSDDPTQVLKISPFGFLIGYYSLDYERAMSEKTSLSLGGGYWNGFGTTPIGLVSINLGSSYYLSKDRYAPRGVYIGPRGSVVFSTDSKSKGVYYSVGGLFGYQSVAKSGFAFDIGIGANYVNFKEVDNVTGTGVVLPAFQLAIGYGF